MAYSFASASTQFLDVAVAPVTATPLTMAGWASIDGAALASVETPICVISNNNFQESFSVVIGSNGTSSDVFCEAGARAANSGAFASTAAIPSREVFRHVAGIFTSPTSRTAYISAANAVTNTTSRTPAAIDRLSIGKRFSTVHANGKTAEVAVWNAQLTLAEIESLFKGFKPTRVRPQSLVFYAPLVRNLHDVKGGLVLSNNNGAAVADHPRVY